MHSDLRSQVLNSLIRPGGRSNAYSVILAYENDTESSSPNHAGK